jgi:septal ring-binding cell division protein DamX
MPDLNLVDEGEMEESSASTPEKVRGGGGGGGGMTGILIMVLVLIIVGGGGFFLYKKGIGPFKRKQAPLISQVQEESFPQETQQQPPAEQQAVKEQKSTVDTTDVALLETPSVDESKAGTGKAGMSKQSDTSGSAMTGMTMRKLGEMKGDYTVQVVAFREKGRAEKTVSNLETAGYPAFAETIPMKGGDWYTVRIGRYPSRQEAKKAVQSFGAQLRSSYVIDKVRNR